MTVISPPGILYGIPFGLVFLDLLHVVCFSEALRMQLIGFGSCAAVRYASWPAGAPVKAHPRPPALRVRMSVCILECSKQHQMSMPQTYFLIEVIEHIRMRAQVHGSFPGGLENSGPRKIGTICVVCFRAHANATDPPNH